MSQEGDETKVRIEAHGTGGGEEKKFDIQLRGSGDQPLDATVHQFQVERKPGRTDADVRAEIERQMRDAGVQGQFTVENGKVEVKVEKQH